MESDPKMNETVDEMERLNRLTRENLAKAKTRKVLKVGDIVTSKNPDGSPGPDFEVVEIGKNFFLLDQVL